MGSNRHMAADSRGAHTPEAARETAPGSQGPAGSRIHNSISRRASLMQEPVLVLNATYEPINVTAVRRAMVLMLKGVAQAEERSEEHTSELQSHSDLVCRLLLEKKNKKV